MARPCSRDLRSRVLSVVEAGESVTATARRFAVGRSTAYRWVATARDEKRRDAKRMRGGPAPAIGGEVAAMVLSLAGEPNNLTPPLISLHDGDGRGSHAGLGWIA